MNFCGCWLAGRTPGCIVYLGFCACLLDLEPQHGSGYSWLKGSASFPFNNCFIQDDVAFCSWLSILCGNPGSVNRWTREARSQTATRLFLLDFPGVPLPSSRQMLVKCSLRPRHYSTAYVGNSSLKIVNSWQNCMMQPVAEHKNLVTMFLFLVVLPSS